MARDMGIIAFGVVKQLEKKIKLLEAEVEEIKKQQGLVKYLEETS